MHEAVLSNVKADIKYFKASGLTILGSGRLQVGSPRGGGSLDHRMTAQREGGTGSDEISQLVVVGPEETSST